MSKDYEIWQGGVCVAKSSDLPDALHYALIYSQDGPVFIKGGPKGRLQEMMRDFRSTHCIPIAEPVTKA